MTKVDLITGFLGVGKTTFIKKYANYLLEKGEKLHIIENDFGGLSIDARELEKEKLDVSRITGGCMCCSGLESFKKLLLKASERGYDRILVEPSGIYDVNQFFAVLESSPVNEFCEIGNIITVADSSSSDIVSKEAEILMYSQLLFSGVVVMSKTQLHSQEENGNAVRKLKSIMENKGSSRTLSFITKNFEEFTKEDFLSVENAGYAKERGNGEVFNHSSVFFANIIFGRFDTLEHLKVILSDIFEKKKYGQVFRIKGFISDKDGVFYELNCSSDGYFVEKADVKRGLFLVIGQDFDEEGIKNLFKM